MLKYLKKYKSLVYVLQLQYKKIFINQGILQKVPKFCPNLFAVQLKSSYGTVHQ